MQLQDYLEFLDPLDIRVKGTRIGLEDLVYAFRQGQTPDEIAAQYHSVTLEQVFGALTYYLHQRAEVDAYITQLEAWRAARRREIRRAPPPVIQRLHARQQGL